MDELAQAKTRKSKFLSQLDEIIPWAEWMEQIQPCYYKGERGNKPYDLELMLRIHVLQKLYALPDRAVAGAIVDSRAFSAFCGIESSSQLPSAGTIRRFRSILVKNGLEEEMRAQLRSLLSKRKLILRKGAIADSTLIGAPRGRKASS